MAYPNSMVVIQMRHDLFPRPWIARKTHFIPPFLIDGVVVQFRPIERNLFAALFNARGGLVTTEEMIAAGWTDPDLTPLWAMNNLAAQICYLRRKLLRTRFRIENINGRGFWLARLRPAAGAVRKAA